MPKGTAKPKEPKKYSASEKYHYHKDEANKAFKDGDIVKTSNHMAGMRRAEKTMQEQAAWAKEHKPKQ
jgi:hypothetical protein